MYRELIAAFETPLPDSCAMILGPISLIDCVVFVIFLLPNLLVVAGLRTLVLVKVLPFLLLKLPYQFLRERYLTKKEKRSPFVQKASIFEDIVIRCVRYAFATIPAGIGRVFFSKWVAYPFFRFRLLRHGFLESPIHHYEIEKKGVRGLWIEGDHADDVEKPDLVVYYLHGGGFSMGSSYFYLEFLISWLTLLRQRGFKYPAIFALEYSLVPDQVFPRQLEETQAGYRFLCEFLGTASTICVSGDSAGATLILSLLLSNAASKSGEKGSVPSPELAILLSPWTHLISKQNRNTSSDYLDSSALHLYADQYAKAVVDDPVVSPGRTNSGRNWHRASPQRGFALLYGSDEVFAPGIEETALAMKRDGATVQCIKEAGGIHAWPVVNLFLADQRADRLRGLTRMTDILCAKIGSKALR